jgi:hypothetical protein
MISRVIRLVVRRALYIVGYSNRIQNGPYDCRGVCQSSGFEGVRVLYPGYRGMLVMAQPQNLARDTPGLLGAAPGGFQ